MKHSPAPWKVTEDENGDTFVVPEEDFAHRIFIGNLEDTCSTCYANANLIASAPELLETLELVMKAFEGNFAIDWNMIQEIIDKAKGNKN